MEVAINLRILVKMRFSSTETMALYPAMPFVLVPTGAGGVGRCVAAAVNTEKGKVISCDTIPGLLKGPELTCTCGR